MGMLRRGVKGVLRRAAEVVATRVAEDELFEKPGERVPPEPLPPRRAADAAGAAQDSLADEEEEPPASAPASVGDGTVPSAGCEKADVARLKRALGPGRGMRVVNHWATWCLPCIDELPHLIALRAELGDAVDFFGVSWDLFDPRGDEDDVVEHVASFAAGNGMDWPSLLVTAEPPEFFQALGIGWEKIPQTWVIGADGEVLRRIEGVVDADLCGALAELVRKG